MKNLNYLLIFMMILFVSCSQQGYYKNIVTGKQPYGGNKSGKFQLKGNEVSNLESGDIVYVLDYGDSVVTVKSNIDTIYNAKQIWVNEQPPASNEKTQFSLGPILSILAIPVYVVISPYYLGKAIFGKKPKYFHNEHALAFYLYSPNSFSFPRYGRIHQKYNYRDVENYTFTDVDTKKIKEYEGHNGLLEWLKDNNRTQDYDFLNKKLVFDNTKKAFIYTNTNNIEENNRYRQIIIDWGYSNYKKNYNKKFLGVYLYREEMLFYFENRTKRPIKEITIYDAAPQNIKIEEYYKPRLSRFSHDFNVIKHDTYNEIHLKNISKGEKIALEKAVYFLPY